ncbi:MAG: DUF3048 domain-containing protein [Actinomycetota bacterium]|nr:DUF3048 domain-containing protein [Actinomycetota bacterium]
MPSRSRATLGIVLVAAATLAACGGDSSGDSKETLPISSLPPTVASTIPPSTVPGPTTTGVPTATYPLTGLPVTDPAAAARPAIVAKVGNYDKYPTTGLNDGDIVFEELINDHITRFAIVYHSQAAKEFVGPVRSGRLQDVDLLTSLNHPILAWAGGNAHVTNDINDSTLVNMNMTHCNGACFRVDFFSAPYNLYFDIAKAWTVAPEGGQTPPPHFTYRSAGEAAQGTPAGGVDLTIDSYKIGWAYNSGTGLYERTQNKKADTERNGDLVTTHNVLILKMAYKAGFASPDAQSIGNGEAWLFSGGSMVHGTWSRTENTQPYTLLADDGTPMKLTPGRTFIELPRTQDTITSK